MSTATKTKTVWMALVGDTYYPVVDIRDSGIPADMPGGGNNYLLQFTDKITWIVNQKWVEDLYEMEG